jgi:hypothetical protein
MIHKTSSSAATSSSASFSEDDIRGYAEHLYEQSGRIPGHDLDNWLEAKACLEANVPRHASHRRLHHHISAARKEPSIPSHRTSSTWPA